MGEVVQVFHRMADVPVVYLVGLPNESRENGLVAQIIHHAWNAFACAVDFADGPGGEMRAALATREREAMANVVLYVSEGQGQQLIMHEDALAKLAEFVARENGLELGLADEDDLEEFLLVGLEIGEKPDLLKHLKGEVLRLIDDEHDVAAGRDAREEDFIDLRDEIVMAIRMLRFTQIREDGLEHLGFVDAGVENERGIIMLDIEFIHQPAAKGGFAAADFTDEHDEALVFPDAVEQVLQRVVVRGTEVKEFWIGRDVEGHLRQRIEALIHGQF